MDGCMAYETTNFGGDQMISLRALPRQNNAYPSYLAPLNPDAFASVRVAPSVHQAWEYTLCGSVKLTRAQSMARHPSAQGKQDLPVVFTTLIRTNRHLTRFRASAGWNTFA